MTWWLASRVTLALCFVCRPTRVTCPPGWYDHDGVRPDGHLTCAPTPVGPDWMPMHPDLSVQPDERVELRVWCGPPAAPVVRDDGLGAECRVVR